MKPQKYWEQMWSIEDLANYRPFYENSIHRHPKFLEIFSQYPITQVCDAACGFGTYSRILHEAGYQLSGFDISEESLKLTRALLKESGIPTDTYLVSDICDIQFGEGSFDAVVAHAVLDHLEFSQAEVAVNELFRIVKTGGLVYLSFDPMEDDDLKIPHQVMQDGSFFYTDGDRKGLLFRHYTDSDIRVLCRDRQILSWTESDGGDRELVLIKR